jgi:hypothetical protein
MGAEQQVRVVRLVGVPVDLYLRAARHRTDLTREFALIAFGDETGVTTNSVPARLLALVDELHNRYARQSSGIRAQFEEAAERGEDTIDVELPAVELAAAMTDRVTTLLDEADEFCRSGQLLTLEAPPEVVAWRHWWRDQVVGQIRSEAQPTPFRE